MKKRWKYDPETGEKYQAHGGGEFVCLDARGRNAIMQNLKSGWTFLAHQVHVYKDGSIDWNWSTGGTFKEVQR